MTSTESYRPEARRLPILMLCLALIFTGSASALADMQQGPVPYEPGLDTIAADLRYGRYTVEQLTLHYLGRIARFDGELNAYISINPEALDRARELDALPASERDRLPLFGVPIAIKDNIDVQGMANTAGSLALRDNFPLQDAPLVARLRAAGAVILGKTNLSEWANFRSNDSVSGWSAMGGQTRNAYDRARNTCGSSSGSGVVLAADLAVLAVGTETDGSVVCPASINGVVGIKPTLGLVSRSGIIPIAASQDTAGAMARKVADAVRLLAVMQGPDDGDPITAKMHADGLALKPPALDPNDLAGRRIGVIRSLTGFNPKATALLEQALGVLREQGAVLVDVEVEGREKVWDHEGPLLRSEFHQGLNQYLAQAPAAVTVRNLADLVEFNREHAEREMPWFGQDILIEALEAPAADSEETNQHRNTARRLAGPEGIDRTLAEHQLDALLALTTAPAWTIDQVNGDHYLGGSSSLAAVAGYPNITVPIGLVQGLPVGMSLFAGRLDDALLVRLAYAYEQASKARRPPAGYWP